jgi:hypothetical protein
MHEELATMMLRELIVCGDILSHSKQSRISKKLNSIQNNANPLALIRNCAWDMYIPRALDALTAITPDQPLSVDFYFPEILSFDGDVTDIINTTKLRAIAIHGPTKKNIPFFDSDIAEWLGNRVGSKRMDALSEYFLIDAFLDRAKRRSSKSAQEILLGNQVELMSLIQKLSSQRHEQR